MSRSKRPPKRTKCICGRSHVPFKGEKRHGKQIAGCPILDSPHQWNARRAKYLRNRLSGQLLPQDM